MIKPIKCKYRFRKLGEISYEMDEDGFVYQIEYIPENEELEEIINLTRKAMNNVETMNINKVNTTIFNEINLMVA